MFLYKNSFTFAKLAPFSNVIFINGSVPVKSKNFIIPQSGFSSIASVNCLQIVLV